MLKSAIQSRCLTKENGDQPATLVARAPPQSPKGMPPPSLFGSAVSYPWGGICRSCHSSLSSSHKFSDSEIFQGREELWIEFRPMVRDDRRNQPGRDPTWIQLQRPPFKFAGTRWPGHRNRDSDGGFFPNAENDVLSLHGIRKHIYDFQQALNQNTSILIPHDQAHIQDS